jgi:23S rRNA pseudouridine2457 synthase
MPNLILFNKPFGVLSQFTDQEGRSTLSDFIDAPGFYPAGRLDRDSEGLLILTNDGHFQQKITNPKYKKPKTYWAQVEGIIDEVAINKLESGVILKDGPTRPAQVRKLQDISIWDRTPPIRIRKSVPDSWISITITEGRNRQVRRMTASVGFPTLRLVRKSIGDWELGTLQPGEFMKID